MDSYKYVRVDNIYQRLTQRIKGKDISFPDIVEWCAECELVEIGQMTDWFRFEGVEVTDITDKQFELPENCWYVKNVKIITTFSSKFVDFYVNGNYLNLEEDYSTVYMDYFAFPTDTATGYLLIPRGHENACYWYCVKNLFLEDYLNNQIDQNRWNVIQGEYELAVEKAVALSSRISENEKIKTLDAKRTTNYNYQNPMKR